MKQVLAELDRIIGHIVRDATSKYGILSVLSYKHILVPSFVNNLECEAFIFTYSAVEWEIENNKNI